LVREVGVSLSRAERFTLLPNNLVSVALHPEADPVFVMGPPPAVPTRLTNLDTAVTSYAPDRGDFRLIRGGRVLARSRDEIVLHGALSNNWLQFATVGKTGTTRWRQFWIQVELSPRLHGVHLP
jgi:hypothetical protein